MYKSLDLILKERYVNNRNLSTMETEDECISTMYFGYGSLKASKKAHVNNYQPYRLSAFFETILNGCDYEYYLSNINDDVLLKNKRIRFSYKELKYILKEFDFCIKNITFTVEDEYANHSVEIVITLLDSADTNEILSLKQKRQSKIESINNELEKLRMLQETI